MVETPNCQVGEHWGKHIGISIQNGNKHYFAEWLNLGETTRQKHREWGEDSFLLSREESETNEEKV